MDFLKNRTHDEPIVHNRRRRSERGMAYLETLLVLPVVLTLILGLADFSFLFKDYLVAGNAASEAARTATLSRGTLCDPSFSTTNAQNNAEQLLLAGGVEPPQITGIDVDHTEPGRTLCDAGMVGVSIDVRSELRFLNLLHQFIPFPPITFTATATALNENGN